MKPFVTERRPLSCKFTQREAIMRPFARIWPLYTSILGIAGMLLIASGCMLNESTRAIVPTSSEAQLRREISKQLKDSEFPTASQAGAPRATP